jgi:hypothetical protein
MEYKNCPVCGASDPVATIFRDRVPTLQNRVYLTKEDAMSASCGSFRLCTCRNCGFSYNGEFDEALMVYDESYDNDVHSRTFELYAEEVARFLIEKHQLTSGTVYDVGCGKGTFLRMLCRLAPSIRGIGIDPSCTPTSEDNFTLIRDVFHPGSLEQDTKLVLLRHVLEHIANPVDFLSELGQAAPEIPLYVEVPEVNWIFENGAFWDFCYEHCNYFSTKSLRVAMQLAGFSKIEQSPSFGGQYQWAIGSANGGTSAGVLDEGSEAVHAAVAYAERESGLIRELRAAIAADRGCAVWGMATKGVMLTCMLSNEAVVGIDINEKKQGKFAPLSGVAINGPEWLHSHTPDTVMIMNRNYANEITQLINQMKINTNIVIM